MNNSGKSDELYRGRRKPAATLPLAGKGALDEMRMALAVAGGVCVSHDDHGRCAGSASGGEGSTRGLCDFL